MLFTWNKDNGNMPIAKVIGGKYNGKIVYLKNEDETPKTGVGKKNECEFCEKSFARKDHLKRHQVDNQCKMALAHDFLKKYMNKEKGEFDGLDLDDGKFQILPHENARSIISISGPSGSGKTHFINQFIEHGGSKKPVFLFSPIENDMSIKAKNIKQIKLDDDIIESPIELKELKDSICLFDDIQAIKKPYKEIVEQLQNDILTTGRHHNIDILNTSHLSTINGNAMRKDLLNESNAYVLFPHASSKNQTINLLKNYASYDTKAVNKLIELPTRWLYCYKNYPNFYVTETKIGSAKNL